LERGKTAVFYDVMRIFPHLKMFSRLCRTVNQLMDKFITILVMGTGHIQKSMDQFTIATLFSRIKNVKVTC
jgi:hypothetical protein